MTPISEHDRERLGEEIVQLLDDPDYDEGKKAEIIAFYHAGQPISTILEDVTAEEPHD